jgi:DNA polymerase-3 subunit epsilon
MTIEKEFFICIDCEATGLDPKNDRIVEIAIAKFNMDGIVESYETLIDPECDIPQSSIEIHHITQDLVTGKPKIQEVLAKILAMIPKEAIIMGHGIKFDIDLIVEASKRFAIPCNIERNKTIDTLRLARLYGESSTNSLEVLRQHFNIPNEIAHRAMSDVVVNIKVFYQLIKTFKTSHQVLERLKKPVKLRTMPLGKHKGRLFKDIPIEYLGWASKQEFDEDLLFSIRSELGNRKKGNLFGQAANPFSNL